MSNPIKLPIPLVEMREKDLSLKEVKETLVVVVDAYNDLVGIVNSLQDSGRVISKRSAIENMKLGFED